MASNYLCTSNSGHTDHTLTKKSISVPKNIHIVTFDIRASFFFFGLNGFPAMHTQKRQHLNNTKHCTMKCKARAAQLYFVFLWDLSLRS